jgi:RimJ/RimL family protein N-acetyltransferase
VTAEDTSPTAMPILSTARLSIRPFAESDLAEFAAILEADAADAGIAQRLTRFLRWAELNACVLADLRQPPYGDRAIVLRQTGETVGAIGLVPLLAPFGQLPGFDADVALNTPEVGLYWAVAPKWRRQGIAVESASVLVRFAFETLRVRRLVAVTETDNAASIGVMRRLGMRIVRNPCQDPQWMQVVGVLDSDRSHPTV